MTEMTTPATPAADAVSLRFECAHGTIAYLSYGSERELSAPGKRRHFELVCVEMLKAIDAATARESALVAERDALRAALISIRDRLVACSEMPISAAEAFDSFYQSEVDEALALAATAVEGV